VKKYLANFNKTKPYLGYNYRINTYSQAKQELFHANKYIKACCGLREIEYAFIAKAAAQRTLWQIV